MGENVSVRRVMWGIGENAWESERVSVSVWVWVMVEVEVATEEACVVGCQGAENAKPRVTFPAHAQSSLQTRLGSAGGLVLAAPCVTAALVVGG